MSIERELLKKVISGDNKGDFFISYDLYKEIYEFLVHPEQSEQEPVAWMFGNKLYKKPYGKNHLSLEERNSFIPLYTAPPKREPLSDDEMRAIWKEGIRCEIPFVEIGRAIEKAHGIGGGE